MKKGFLLAGLLLFLSAYSHTAICEADSVVWHQTFDEDQIEWMKRTRAIIHTPYGDIRLKFFPEVAPNHVFNFIQLSRIGFYNKTLFHRVVPGFMIQGGDPYSRQDDTSYHGQGGVGYAYNLQQEFNDMPHEPGTLSMARSSNPDSAGCQFFICVDREPGLDGQYTVFGEVVDAESQAVADAISMVDTDNSEIGGVGGHPIDPIEIVVEIEFQSGDVTGDGKTDLREVLRIMRHMIGVPAQ